MKHLPKSKYLSWFLYLSVIWLPVQAVTFDQLPKIQDFAVGDASRPFVYAATNGGLFISKDNGASWADPDKFKFPVTMVEAAPDGSVYAFVVTRGLLRMNAGETEWVSLSNSFGGQVINKFVVIENNPLRFLAQNQYGKVIRSDNGGVTWTGSMGGLGPKTEQEKRGKTIYDSKCQSCHGVDGVGEVYTEAGLTTKGYLMAPALDDSTHAWHHTDDSLVKTIMEGSERTERMKAWKDELKEGDARDIVAYMKSMWGKRALDCQGPKHMKCM
jgi:mono/diheme cytochrome c family protein